MSKTKEIQYANRHERMVMDGSLKTKEEIFEYIAATVLRLETLKTRHSDSFDFHDMAVWTMKQALELAYLAARHAK